MPPQQLQESKCPQNQEPLPFAKRNTRNWNYALRSGLAGGIAGCAAKSVIAPLDRVKILFQADNRKFKRHAGSFPGIFRAMGEIVRESGIRGLYQGHSATLLRIYPYAAIKFMSFEQFKTLLMPTKEYATPLRTFAAGSLAGVITVLCTYPLDLIRVRLAFNTFSPKPPGILETVKEIWGESRREFFTPTSSTTSFSSSTSSTSSSATAPTSIPRPSQPSTSALPSPTPASAKNYFRTSAPASNLSLYFQRHLPIINFYRGFTPTLVGMVPYAGVSFYVYGSLTHYCQTRLKSVCVPPPQPLDSKDAPPRTPKNKYSTELKGWVILACGGVAGAIAQTVAYPMEVIRRRMQVGGALHPEKFVGVLETARMVHADRGIRGFFVGLSIGYLKVAPMSAVSFLVYEEMKILLGID